MPELPEVESVRRGVHEWTAGATVVSAQFIDSRILGTTSARDLSADAVTGFTSAVAGRRIRGAERRGKFMWLELEDQGADVQFRVGGAHADASELSLLIHLGMSGQLRVHQPGDERHRHTRAIFTLERDGARYELRFIDQRIFGHLGVQPLAWSSGRFVPASAGHIAADPLEPAFDFDAAIGRLAARRTALKSALLDQTVVSGIGNIYADEALFRAKVHPLAIPARTRRSRLVAVLDSAVAVMSDALRVGGTSFDSLYVNVNGESGYFGRALLAYGRGGQSCVRCGTEIVKITVGGRGTHFCPICQKTPRYR